MSETTEESFAAIKSFVTLDSTTRMKLVKITSDVSRKKNENYEYISKISDEWSMPLDELMKKISVVLDISRYFSNLEKSRMIQIVEKLGFDKDQQNALEETVSYIKELKIPETIQNYVEYNKILSFGLPQFMSLELMADYRIYSPVGEKKEIVPIIVSTIDFDKVVNSVDEQLTFQFHLEQIDDIITILQQFKKKVEEEITLLKKGLSD